MKCRKPEQNHIIHLFAEESEGQKIDIETIYMPSGAREKFLWVTFFLKTHFAIMKFDI